MLRAAGIKKKRKAPRSGNNHKKPAWIEDHNHLIKICGRLFSTYYWHVIFFDKPDKLSLILICFHGNKHQ